MQKILIIEDNNEINHMLFELLKKNGYETKQAFSGTEGLLYFSLESFDLILMDLMLPGMSGETVLANIRKKSDIPIVIISAKTEVEGKINLLENGADDYITKPFDLREVMARVRLQINKAQSGTEYARQEIISAGELHIDSDAHSVKIHNEEISVTRQEFNILYLLFKNPGKVFTKQELFELAWEEYYFGADKTLNVHISNIRNKLKEYTDVNYIETVWGIGFKASGIK
jgi:DNA-binding response OmpR family regulator